MLFTILFNPPWTCDVVQMSRAVISKWPCLAVTTKRVPRIYQRLQSRRISATPVVSDPAVVQALPTLPRGGTSSRLAALHARLQLSPKFSLESLARCLVDASADPHTDFNNHTAALLGEDLIAYFAAEALQCRFPRLPTDVLFAAMAAYAGPKALTALAHDWGLDAAAAPGPEVDPGYLQYRRKDAGNAALGDTGTLLKEITPPPTASSTTRPNAELQTGWRRTVSSRTLYENEFGSNTPSPEPSTTFETACACFVRAVFGHVYLGHGLQQTKQFFQSHILSRHLDVSTLFQFRQPTVDLSKLCAREGFAPPVARILCETGRLSVHPVFLVGIFSGREKLGEAAGASLDEARIRAAIMSLKSWYLYSPVETKVPSDTIGTPDVPWEPLLVDQGEIVA